MSEVDLVEYEAARAVVRRVHAMGGPAVYVYRDTDGGVLYVGETQNLITRMSGHRQQSWWPRAATMEVIRAPRDRRDRRAIEAALIADLNPEFNGKQAVAW